MRAWAAPRLEQSGQALEKKVAPRMSAMLSSAARKIDPPRRTRRRWPFFVAGAMALGAAGAAAMGWRSAQAKSQQSRSEAEVSGPEGASAPAGESNAKVHTP
jgi:ferric-dicitrate binding protein FerR (iron transport regulator)